ncbi:MAG: hypothetical protein GY828_04630 [Candidatus Gracilibacteria bacterium]|nr:hypothetical protein [Candidatus Gracilibacteria bacterium]
MKALSINGRGLTPEEQGKYNKIPKDESDFYIKYFSRPPSELIENLLVSLDGIQAESPQPEGDKINKPVLCEIKSFGFDNLDFLPKNPLPHRTKEEMIKLLLSTDKDQK